MSLWHKCLQRHHRLAFKWIWANFISLKLGQSMLVGLWSLILISGVQNGLYQMKNVLKFKFVPFKQAIADTYWTVSLGLITWLKNTKFWVKWALPNDLICTVVIVFVCLFVLRFYGPVNTLHGVTSFFAHYKHNTCKRLSYSQTFCGILQCNGGKLEESELLFHRFLCAKIEIDQFLCVNCRVINHGLSVSCKVDNWPTNHDLLLNNSLLELIYFLIEPHHGKTCFCLMRTAKAQISLHIRAVWSAHLLFAA